MGRLPPWPQGQWRPSRAGASNAPRKVCPKTAKFGGRPPTTSEVGNATQGPGVFRIAECAPFGGAQHFQAFCLRGSLGTVVRGQSHTGALCGRDRTRGTSITWSSAGGSFREKRKKSVPIHSFPKKTACSSYVQPWLVAVGGWRLVAVGGWRLVAVGGWRLVAVGGWQSANWRLVVGDWWLVAVGSGWRLAVGRRWRFWRRLVAVGGWWRLAVLAAVGGWRLGSLGAVLNNKEIQFLKDPPGRRSTGATLRGPVAATDGLRADRALLSVLPSAPLV